MSGLGNQHNNGPHQDQVFHNPSALCLALWAKTPIRLPGGGCSIFFSSSSFVVLFFSPSDLLCLRSSRSKYNRSILNYLLLLCLVLFSFFLHCDLKKKTQKKHNLVLMFLVVSVEDRPDLMIFCASCPYNQWLQNKTMSEGEDFNKH